MTNRTTLSARTLRRLESAADWTLATLIGLALAAAPVYLDSNLLR